MEQPTAQCQPVSTIGLIIQNTTSTFSAMKRKTDKHRETHSVSGDRSFLAPCLMYAKASDMPSMADHESTRSLWVIMIKYLGLPELPNRSTPPSSRRSGYMVGSRFGVLFGIDSNPGMIDSSFQAFLSRLVNRDIYLLSRMKSSYAWSLDLTVFPPLFWPGLVFAEFGERET